MRPLAASRHAGVVAEILDELVRRRVLHAIGAGGRPLTAESTAENRRGYGLALP
jgi:hypothetical protein